jgi:dipicolinate synthase subunit A
VVDISAYFVAGGDRRIAELAAMLAADGHTVSTYALCTTQTYSSLRQAAQGARYAILPLPLADGDYLNAASGNACTIEELFEAIKGCEIVFAGKVGKKEERLARKLSINLLDYYSREDLQVANAIPTAEGAIELAMRELPVTIWGSDVLVVGYGRVGRILADRLKALGAVVTVAARRSSERVWAEAYGCRAVSVDELAFEIPGMKLVINTVPAQIIGENALRSANPETLFIDLASKPGGIDKKAAQSRGLRIIHALSLPGNVASVTSAAIIKKTIYNMLSEQHIE